VTGSSDPYSIDNRESLTRKRNSAKVLVELGGRVLFTLNRDAHGDFLLLPGGGQRFGETLAEAAARETLEETGWLVEPGRLLLVREYIGALHEFRDEDGDVHQTEFVFGSVPVEHRPLEASERDAWQTGSAWLDPVEAARARIYPSILGRILGSLLDGSYDGPVYLGDVN